MNGDIIKIYDNDELLTFTYEDLREYHGGEFPGGVALVYKMMVWIFSEIANEIPHRKTCSFYSGIGINGKGIIDGANLVMQVKENGRLNLDLDYCANKDAPLGPGGGKYYFELGFNGKLYKLAVKQNVIPDDFFSFSRYLHQKKNENLPITEQDLAQAQTLRNSLAKTILKTKPEELFRLCL